jgi:hypothetical protein
MNLIHFGFGISDFGIKTPAWFSIITNIFIREIIDRRSLST